MSRTLVPVIAGLAIAVLPLAGCTSDPDATINQSFPIRQMDRFFGSVSAPPARSDYSARSPGAVSDYSHEPGYAPAYPPY